MKKSLFIIVILLIIWGERLGHVYGDISDSNSIITKEKQGEIEQDGIERKTDEENHQVQEDKGNQQVTKKQKAIQKLKDAAEKGDADSIYQLGILYDIGDGVLRNKKKAFNYFAKAADMGLPLAQFRLATCYEYGRGVPVDVQLAKKWYKSVLNNKQSDKKLYERAWNAHGYLLVRILESKDEMKDFFDSCLYAFDKFPSGVYKEPFRNILKRLAYYSKSHQNDYEKETAIHQMMGFIVVAYDNYELADKFNNLLIQLKSDPKIKNEIKEWSILHDKWVDMYNDMLKHPEYPNSRNFLREASNGIRKCKVEIAKYQTLSDDYIKQYDDSLTHMKYNWNMAKKCLTILSNSTK